MNTLTRIAVFFTILTAAPRLTVAQYYELRPRFEAGSEIYYRAISNGHQIVRNPATLSGAVTKTEMLNGYRLRVLDGQGPDHHPLELTFLSFVHRYVGPTRAEFDSMHPDECANAEHRRIAQTLLGTPFQITLNDAGDVIAVKGLESFIAETINGADPVLYSMYSDLISPQTLRHMLMYQYFRNAPDEVLRGGGWQARIEDLLAGGSVTVQRDLQLTLEQAAVVQGRSVARILIDGNIRQTGAQRQTHPEAPRVGSIDGKEAGTLYVDVVNGILLSGTSRIVTSADVAFHTDGEMLERRIDQQTAAQVEMVESADALNWRPPRPAPPATQPATQPAASQPSLQVDTTPLAPQ